MKLADVLAANVLAVTLVLAITLHCSALRAAQPTWDHRAPINLLKERDFVALPLPASVFSKSRQPGLNDLRVVDANGERVPFAMLPARGAVIQHNEQQRQATLYPLPHRDSPTAALGSPIELHVDGDRISLRRLGASPSGISARGSPGWLVDLGERSTDQPIPQTLRLDWNGPAEFSATFDIDASDSLREWRPSGSGQLLALTSSGGSLTQRDVVLPANGARFVRIVWRDPVSAPALTSALALTRLQRSIAHDPLTELQFAISPEPVGKGEAPGGSMHFDLGGDLPVLALDLTLPQGTRVLPARIQGRSSTAARWQDLGTQVFFRLQRDGTVSTSAPLALQTHVRYVRLLIDERLAPPDPAESTLVIHARLPTLVFAMQGKPPYALQAGAGDARPGALPIGTLVPKLEEERAHLGLAELGSWREMSDATAAAAAEARNAALRTGLLWAVLLAGVSGLGAMVWRLTRSRHPA